MTSAMAAAPQGRPLESVNPAPIETQVGIWEWHFATHTFSVDPLWCSSLGINPCKGPDHSEEWLRQIHPDDAPAFQRRRDAVRTGDIERFELEYRLLVHKARWLWVLQRGRIVERDADG